MSRAWSAVFEGATRERAGALVAELARVIAPPARHRGASLAHGMAGAALCLGYVAGDAGIDAAAELVGGAIDGAAELPLRLGDGSVGVAWVIEHLQRTLRWSEDDPNSGFDDVLLDYIAQPAWHGPWGWWDGLGGLAGFLIERLPSVPDCRASLERLVVHLLEGAHTSTGLGATWWTARGHIAPVLGHAWGHYDLGMASGVPGVLAVLAQIHAAGVARAEVRGLLLRGLDWIWAKRTPRGMPRYLGPGVTGEPSAVARWDGALGAGAALLRAADAIGEPERIAEIEAWLVELVRDGFGALTEDVSLATGAAGAGQVCARLFQRTGHAVFAERAQACVLHALERTVARRDAWSTDDAGLVSGLAGVALVLHAASSSRAPSWDRVLLLPGAEAA